MWKEEQGEAPPDTIMLAFDALQGTSGVLSESGLYQLLMAPVNDVSNPSLTEAVYMDMTRPLTEYYIHASHRSYLDDGSIELATSTEMVARALLRGCRYIDLDLRDGTSGTPEVHHPLTLAPPARCAGKRSNPRRRWEGWGKGGGEAGGGSGTAAA